MYRAAHSLGCVYIMRFVSSVKQSSTSVDDKNGNSKKCYDEMWVLLCMISEEMFF